ncbi:hypothetical protein [Demequina sp. SO4-18]|uniref:hypothetical protein n=1 Tax=Demequina sp. SO4-18 TaxID=3401026 RepID=UPI003B5ADBE8
MSNETDTIGTITHGDITYDVDWPRDPENGSVRNELSAFLYVDGDFVGDVAAQTQEGEKFTSESQVMDAARRTVAGYDS